MNTYQTGNQTSHQKCRCKMLREHKSESRILFQPPYVSIARVKRKKTLRDIQRAIRDSERNEEALH